MVGIGVFAASFPVIGLLPDRGFDVAAALLGDLAMLVASWLVATWLVDRAIFVQGVFVFAGVAGHVMGVLGSHHVVGSIAALAGCVGIGVLSTRACERISWWIGALGIASVADFYSVVASSGVTRQLHEDGGSQSLQWLQLWLGEADGTAVAAIGLIDIVALGLIFGFVRMQRLPATRALVALVIAAAVMLSIGPYVYSLPALPFWTVAIVAAYLPWIRHSRAI